MKKEYEITGMTCGGCVAKVKKTIEDINEVDAADIQLKYPQATITSVKPLNIAKINMLLGEVGNYLIKETKKDTPNINTTNTEDIPDATLSTYKPLFLIVLFIAGISLLAQYPFKDGLALMTWMRHFMAGFFVVFGFFKLLNLRGFVSSYKMYDIIAAKWTGWGYLYPFIEIILGLLYLTNIAPVFTNIATVVILGISSIGVIQSNLNKRKIKCACLGDVFNLPMSTVTIIEDLTMVAMGLVMLILV